MKMFNFRTKFEVVGAVFMVAILLTACVLGGTRIISDSNDNIKTFITNSNGGVWEATWDNLKTAFHDLNITGGKLSLPSDGSITSTGTIHVFNGLDVGVVIEGNGCNLIKGTSAPFFNFSGYDAWPTVLRNEPISISNINFDCADYDGYALIIEQKQYVTLDNLFFNNSDNTTTGEPYILMGTRSYFCDISNCIFENGYAGIKFFDNYGLGYGASNYGKVYDCVFDNLSDYAIDNIDTPALIISGVNAEKCGNETTNLGTFHLNAKTHITKCYVERNRGVTINVTADYCRISEFIHFEIDDYLGICIDANHTEIIGNIFIPVGRGIIKIIDGHNITISGNVHNGDTYTCTYFVTSQTNSVKDLDICDNTVYATVKTLLLEDVCNVDIINNRFYYSGNLQNVYIKKDADKVENINIKDNLISCDTNTADGVYLSGAPFNNAFVSGNTFYVPSGDGIHLLYADDVHIYENNFEDVTNEVTIGTGVDRLSCRDNINYLYNRLFPFYEQTSAPTIADNCTAYWYDTNDDYLYQITNSYGSVWYVNMTKTI